MVIGYDGRHRLRLSEAVKVNFLLVSDIPAKSSLAVV
jgi:hypothetical protein